MNRRRYMCLAAAALLAWIAFLLRAGSLDTQSLWRDEVDALRFATAPWSEMLSNFTRPGWNGPLYYLLLRGWIALTGTSEYALRFFSLSFGVLCIPLTYVLGCRLFNSAVGITAALLVTTSPYLVWYSQEVKMYTLVPALALLAVYSLRRALEGGGWSWWLIQIAATSLAFYAHILAALLIPVQILLALAWWPQARKRWRGALISLACLTLPYLPLVVWQAPMALQERETGFYDYSLRQMIIILLKGWSTGITGWGSLWGTALLSVLAGVELLNHIIYALPSLIRTLARSLVALVSSFPLPPLNAPRILIRAVSEPAEDLRERLEQRAQDSSPLALLIWLSVPLLCVWLISLRQPLFTDRYLIWSAPAFYLLVALSLISFATIKHKVRWVVVPLLVAVLVINGVNLHKQAVNPIKADFRAAAAYVASYEEPLEVDEPASSERETRYTIYLPIIGTGPSSFDDLIIFQMPYIRYTFDYYFPVDTYPHAEGLYTNRRTTTEEHTMSEAQAAQQIMAMTRGYDVVWLVASEVSMWDKRNLVQQWLDEHAQRVATAHFNRVDVYRYKLSGP